MIDEDDHVMRSAEDDGELLLYDFFKHLTSLTILVLGGVLIVAQAADPADVKEWIVVAVLILVSGGGVFAFSGSNEIVRARSTKSPVRSSVRWARTLAPALLALGVGMFLSMFVDTPN